jgi:hypothetical protein
MKRNSSWKETAVPDPVAITSRLDHRRPAGRSAAPAVLHELDQHEQTMEVEAIPQPGHELVLLLGLGSSNSANRRRANASS